MATNDETGGLIFEDPPFDTDGRRGPSALGKWLEQLHRHPGRWARWDGKVSNSTVTSIRQGRYSGAAAGEFEAVSGTVDGERCLYARYIGEGGAS